VALTIPYWLTLFEMKPYVTFQGAVSGPYSVLKNLGRWLPGWYALEPDMPAFWFVGMAAAGFALNWRRVPYLPYVAGALALFMFMTMPESRWLWKLGLPVLKYVQFPWRLHGVIALAEYIAIVHLAARIPPMPSPNIRTAIVLGCAAIVLTSGPQFRLLTPVRELAHQVWPRAKFRMMGMADGLARTNYGSAIGRLNERQVFITMAPSGEFVPKDTHLNGIQHRLLNHLPMVLRKGEGEQDGEAVAEAEGSTPHRIRFRVAMHTPGGVLINQLYLPGWRVRANGAELPFVQSVLAEGDRVERDWRGRVLVVFTQPGTYDVEAWYDGPPGWELRNALMAALLLGAGWGYHKRLAIARFLAKRFGHASHRQNAA
jgi:hypothetical protein